MLIENNDVLVLQGDSTTDCGRARPYGEGWGSLGDGYAQNVSALLDSVYPERHIRVINMGVSGNTSRDLRGRWEEDTMALKPNWVSIMIGINDIWRQYDCPLHREMHVYVDEYEANLRAIIERTLPDVKGLVLMTPFYMEQYRKDAMRASTDQYGDVVKRLSEEYGVLFADTQAAMDVYFQQYEPISMSWDRVHPNHVGSMILARCLLETLEFDWRKGL